MGKINLVDSTLRDGGYINDWQFGEATIRGVCDKLAKSGIEAIEVGFVKGDTFSKDRTMFSDTACAADLISPKDERVIYVGMLDMSAPVPFEKIGVCDGKSLDALRVIFKKDKIDLGYKYCRKVKELGYKLFVQLVGTDNYTDTEFVEVIRRFNDLKPDAVYIVDSFGLIKRKHFLRLVYLADNNLAQGIALGYHSHNNLQQAFGNAEALVDCNLLRDVYIDACVFGMGRGAGNLNLELFAEYLNEKCGKNYGIEPIIEIADEFLSDIYNAHPWGYSLPFYISASNGVHPNYAIYFGQKNTLTAKSIRELMRGMTAEDRKSYTKEKAERYYLEYQKNFYDDRKDLIKLERCLQGREILLLAPGKSLIIEEEKIEKFIFEVNPTIIAVNFNSDIYPIEYIFSSNMRRYYKMENVKNRKKIITSNIKDAKIYDYMLNYSSFVSQNVDIVDNAGLMFLRVLQKLGFNRVFVAGMDGYSESLSYYDKSMEHDFMNLRERNKLIHEELIGLRAYMKIEFITKTMFTV